MSAIQETIDKWTWLQSFTNTEAFQRKALAYCPLCNEHRYLAFDLSCETCPVFEHLGQQCFETYPYTLICEADAQSSTVTEEEMKTIVEWALKTLYETKERYE